MAIKKAYVALVEFLHANVDVPVGQILEQVEKMCSAAEGAGSRMGNSIVKSDLGETKAIFCTYHQKWELVDQVSFSVKSSSPSGYASMCKEGAAAHVAAGKQAEKAKAGLLDLVMKGELNPADIPAAKAAIIAESEIRSPRGDGLGFATKDEVLATLAA